MPSCPFCQSALTAGPQGTRPETCPSCGKSLVEDAVRGGGWYISRQNQKLGPFSWSQLQGLAQAGMLAAGDQIGPEGATRWGRAGAYPDLFAARAPGAPTILQPGGRETVRDNQKSSSLPESAAGVQGSIETLEVPGSEPKAKQAGADSAATAPLSRPRAEQPPDPAPPAVAGYEILEVLGRGGMGIVYKARQVRLKRLVALKMILGGAHAGAQQVARFRLEAEAIARLQHPHIVQIHEIGEHDGLPFCALEFVDGGSLAEHCAGKPQPPAESAALVQTLARAMYAAHQQGIVHRDLKPANILLAENSEQRSVSSKETGAASDHCSRFTGHWNPKITDFGLAKQLDSDSGQTRSGAIMGTPSYMAPEQAAGRLKEIGPRTDVYGLGAILYELLTGRPPFRGETVVQTLEQVCNQEPVPPSRLQPRLPRDLETICLKALAKEPQRRYSSALALAQDLERSQAGESILARPEGPAARLWRKVRRRPRVVAAFVLLLLLASAAIGHFAFKARESEEKVILSTKERGLLRDFNDRLEAKGWADDPAQTREFIEEMDALLAEIAAVDPEQADQARQRLHQRLADAILAYLRRQSALEADGEAHVEAQLALLAPRAADLARTVGQEFQKRRTELQPVFHLRAPFATGPVFKAAKLKVLEQTLESPIAAGAKPPHLVFTSVACQGNVELKATFHPAWQSAARIGVALNASADRQKGYVFVLRVPAPLESADAGASGSGPGTFAAVRQAGGTFRLQIIRNGARLAERSVPAADIPDGPLTLVARRVGDRLSLQVNERKTPLVIRDVFPLGGTQPGVFAVDWPAGVRLESLQAWRQLLAPAPLPLEKGDELFAGGQWNAALAAYRAQANTASDGKAQREARYKEALCFIQLQQFDDAVALLNALVQENDPRWSVLAQCQRWLILLRQERVEEADAVFARLSSLYRLEDLLVHLPDELLQSILERYKDVGNPGMLDFLLYNPNRVRHLQRAVAIETFFQVAPETLRVTEFLLFRAAHMAGDLRLARATAEGLLQRQSVTTENSWWWLPLVEEYCWLLRLQGDAKAALTELDRRMFTAPGVCRAGLYFLYLERARIHIELGQLDQAEQDLDDFERAFRAAAPSPHDYRFASGVALLRGFLCDQRREPDQAQAAWGRGLNKFQLLLALRKSKSSLLILNGWMLLSLTGDLADFEIELLLPMVLNQLRQSGQSTTLMKFIRAFESEIPPAPVTAAIVRETWRTPEGRALARRIVFQQLSLPASAEESLRLFMLQAGRHLVFPGQRAPDQEQLLRTLVESAWKTYVAGGLDRNQLFQLGMTWKGLLDIEGWQGVAPGLKPDLRGPLAYVFAQRQRQLNKPIKDIRSLLQTALNDAPNGSALQRLAAAELNNLNEK